MGLSREFERFQRSQRNPSTLVMGVAVVLLLGLLPARGQGTLVATLNIPATGQAITSDPLVLGAPYVLQASGTAYYSTPSGSLFDARAHSPSGGPWQLNPDSQPSDLIVNGTSANWLGTTDDVNFATNVFSPSHVYRLDWTGTGGGVQIYMLDSFYPDNSGTIQVDIFSVPEPACTTVLALALLLAARRLRSI